MKGKIVLIVIAVILVLLGITGFVVYKAVFAPVPQQPLAGTGLITPEALPTAPSSISVNLTASPSKANTVVLSVSGMGGKMTGVEYQLQYQSKGVVKGVTSGNPIAVTGQDTLSREIYLGTCSKNDCTPDTGVTTVSVAMVFTDTAGAKTQFSKDYSL